MNNVPERFVQQGSARTTLWRSLLRISLFLVGGFTLLWGVESIRQQDPFARFTQRLAQSGLQEIELLLESPTLTLREGNRIVAQLKVDRLTVDRNRILWRAHNLRDATLYDEAGKPLGYASAREITYNQSAQRLHIAGEPQLQLLRTPLIEKPTLIRTAWLTWDLYRRRLEVPVPLYFEWEGGGGVAENLRWDMRSGTLTLGAGRFTVQVQEKPKREVQIEFASASAVGDVRTMRDMRLRDGDSIAFAPQAREEQRKKYIVATGELRFEDPRVEILGKNLQIWYADNQKRALLNSGVRMRIKPQRTEPAQEEETELEEAKRYPIDVECPEIEYYYRKKIAYLRGEIRAVQRLPEGRIRTLIAKEGEYDQEKEQLTLREVLFEEPERVRLKCQVVILSTREGEDRYEATGCSGVLYDVDEEEEPRGASPR